MKARSSHVDGSQGISFNRALPICVGTLVWLTSRITSSCRTTAKPLHDNGMRHVDGHQRLRVKKMINFDFGQHPMLWTLIDSMYGMGVKQLTALLAAIAAVATVLTLAMPVLAPDVLDKRMKSVALEREKIRQRERERLARGEKEKVSLRQSPKQYMARIVEQFNLTKWLAQEAAREKLVQAGFRGQAPYVAFLFFRLITPVVMFLAALFYMFVVVQLDQPAMVKIGFASAPPMAACEHHFLPQESHLQAPALDQAAFPDALDLLLICVESACPSRQRSRVSGNRLTVDRAGGRARLPRRTVPLQDRKMAYENLAKRTDLDGVKAVCLALQQAERYGTPMAQTLRVMSQENRDMRMSDAEKKAAGLPPKLTVPMILFFLPVLFVVILGPAAIRVMSTQEANTAHRS
jgi:tight adherence protein C